MPQSGYQFKAPPQGVQYLLADVTERQVPRNVDNQNQQEDYQWQEETAYSKKPCYQR